MSTAASKMLGTWQVTRDAATGNELPRKSQVDSLIQAAIDTLVAAAPGALDTLNELAAALGDDQNFATTVTDALAGKLSLTGGTMTGELILSADATDPLEAVPLQQLESYVASEIAAIGVPTVVRYIDVADSESIQGNGTDETFTIEHSLGSTVGVFKVLVLNTKNASNQAVTNDTWTQIGFSVTDANNVAIDMGSALANNVRYRAAVIGIKLS